MCGIEQKNLGTGNTNNINSNNFTCIINIEGKEKNVPISDLFYAITHNFKEEDIVINKLLPNKVLINKTNNQEPYKTDKIIKSLLQLGIPLEATYEIAQSTINKIKSYIEEYEKCHDEEPLELTTKEIRKMVSNSIQEMDVEKFSYSDIELWNNQYVRRYGHNNKRIQVYYSDRDTVDDISYDYITNKLLKDVVYDITNSNTCFNKISSHHKQEIANEILSFINRCDLYKINYDVLKSIIKEIAIQPPHPWFINNLTKKEIIEYDTMCLKNNIEKLELAINENQVTSQSIKIEILHHASALILEKYDNFLGCYDLAAFYLLKNLLNDLLDTKNWDLVISNTKLNSITSDLFSVKWN